MHWRDTASYKHYKAWRSYLRTLLIGGFKMTIENAKALQEQLANEAIAQLRKNGNNELVDDCIQSIAVVGKA